MAEGEVDVAYTWAREGVAMLRVRLIHWKAAEAGERVEQLRSAGYEVVYRDMDGTGNLKELTDDPADAVVIDLGRLPSHGRDIGLYLRERKSTRHVPLLFAGGDPQKVERIKELLPDAAYASWNHIGDALRSAISNAPVDPVVPRSNFDAYSGTPLPKKLGIKEGSSVLLMDPPEDFGETLGALPDGASLYTQTAGPAPLAVWFTRSRADLEGRLDEALSSLAETGSLWIATPKKASGVATDLNQNIVREVGLSAGLVDYKVCSIDRTWSGLLFTRRRSG